MRSENDDQLLPAQLGDVMPEGPKKSKTRYMRELLLSLSELDVCSKLPGGFDSSILSEFEDISSTIPERSRIPGTLSSQNFRRGEYSSSPPNNYTRTTQGRWDTRSSGSNDRDADSQLDSESDSGRRYVNQSRRPWQNPEHDGLLGSGSFPKPTGYISASAVTKVRGSGQYQLNRSNEPYQPPRPYKAAPHSRNATDSINDETFASFEQFRKEQKANQEKQKQFPDKHKENVDPDVAAHLVEPEDEKKLWDKNIGLEDIAPFNAHGDSAKCLSAAQTSASRPLVPPGFTGMVLEKNMGTKSLIPQTVGNAGGDINVGQTEGHLEENGTPKNRRDEKSVSHAHTTDQQYGIKTAHAPFTDISVKSVTLSSDVAVYESPVIVANPSGINSNLPEVYGGLRNDEGTDFYAAKVPGHGIMGIASQEHSTSILEKLFGKASVGDGVVSSFTEFHRAINRSADQYLLVRDMGVIPLLHSKTVHAFSLDSNMLDINNLTSIIFLYYQPGDVNTDARSDVNADTRSHIPFQSSKFTHWFVEEEKKPEDDLSSGKPESLLSLIVNGEKDGPLLSRVSDQKPAIFPSGSNELNDKSVTPTTASATIEPPYQCSNQGNNLGVLTCEDLEQSILSEFCEKRPSPSHSSQAWGASAAKTELRPDFNNLASQHLFSLLQKGTSVNDINQVPNREASENLFVYDAGTVSSVLSNASAGDVGKVPNSENNVTLETLFGTAFMKELQSFKAPVSVQRGSVSGVTKNDVLDSQKVAFPVTDEGFPPNTPQISTLEGVSHVSNHIQQNKSNKNEERWLDVDAPQSKKGSTLNNIGAFDRSLEALDIQLPEEESLITLGDHVIPQHAMGMPAGNASDADLLSSSSMPVDIVDRLAAFSAVFQKERSMIPSPDRAPFHRGPYNHPESELPYQNHQGRPTSQFDRVEMNHGRPLFPPLDSHPSHMNPPINIIGPENGVRPEFAQHHFPANTVHPNSFQHAPNGPTRFSPPAHHPLLQQMHMQGNLLPPHLLRGVPRGLPLSPYSINHMPGYAPEPNPMQNIPFGHHQPSYRSLDLPMQALGVNGGGNNHPEALEKMIEMDLRVNLKQNHPVPGTAHNLGSHVHGIDMGFRYRQ
ncbi:hypothetical protein IFM89_023732 [Coptis chinensis]|uniref:Uncharacterized protein n=1 Tax=Coptis chinensis TaxID=261450 RepID=A0A835M6D3_9MAGN|nr:hypothetical protein IFM89_023732 [Coptis chinensis]